MINKFKAAAMAAALAVSFSANANFVVDTFNDFTPQFVNMNNQTSSVATSEAIGGYRDLSVGRFSGQTSISDDPSIHVEGGAMSFSSGSPKGLGQTGWGKIRYDGAGTGNQFLLNLDLTGLTTSIVSTLYADSNFPFAITLFTNATQWTKLVLPATGVDDPTDIAIQLSLFSGGVNGVDGAADLTKIGALEIELLGVDSTTGKLRAVDATIDQISVVPEPASLALVGLGLLGMGSLRRRASK